MLQVNTSLLLPKYNAEIWYHLIRVWLHLSIIIETKLVKFFSK